MSDEQVIVAGAGPVGLWLACELRLAGVSTLVVERATERSPHSKALGIHPRTIEVLAMRGLADRFLGAGVKVPGWHFGLLDNRLDFRPLETPFPFMLAHPQARTEEVLEEHAAGLGVRILKGHAVTGLTQDASSVTVGITGPGGTYTREAEFVVGCDGAGSTVRRAAGIGFPGTDASVFGFLGDVRLDAPPPDTAVTWYGEGGIMALAPVPGGRFRVMGYDAANQEPAAVLTMEELRATAVRLAGGDFGMRDPVWLSRFGNATRQAASYREGRVLLAGDAAHMHFPAGGVGLNVGLQDAMNLGWKLAAHVQGRAAPGLLDSYHAERHPVGAALAAHTLAQTALITATGPEGRALRTLMSGLIASQPGLSLELAAKLTALDVAYPAPDPRAHPLTGTRAPDLAAAGDGDPRLFGVLRHGRPVLLNFAGPAPEPAAGRASSLGITTCSGAGPGKSGGSAWSEVTAAIIRPDGHVWWATDERAALDTVVLRAVEGLGTAFRSDAVRRS